VSIGAAPCCRGQSRLTSALVEELAIKGPGSRKYVVRRVWECPICRRRDWTGGEVVSRICPCQGDISRCVCMKLVEEKPGPDARKVPASVPTPQPAPTLAEI